MRPIILLITVVMQQIVIIVSGQEFVYSCIVDEDKRTCLKNIRCKSGYSNCMIGNLECGACNVPLNNWKKFCEEENKGRSVRYQPNESNSGICKSWRFPYKPQNPDI